VHWVSEPGPEILKVKEVKPTGVLIVENQHGEVTETHRELCRPCLLPNVEGTTHPDMRIPSAVGLHQVQGPSQGLCHAPM
jgi:hypothetical protein